MKAIFIHMLTRMTHAKGLHTQAILFFILTLSTFVFAIGNEPAQLAHLISGLIWAILLLTSLLGLNDLLENDWANGTLDNYLLSPHALPALMAAKLLAHFTATTLPIAFAATLCVTGITPDNTSNLLPLFIGLVLGGLGFSAIGLLGAALTLGSHRTATLQAVIVMPLCIPPLIFGAGAASAPQLGVSPVLPLFLLAAFSVTAVTLAPFATAAIVRMKVTTP